MAEQPGYAAQRPKDRMRLKKDRTLSFTDAEYEKLVALAVAAGLGVSEYVVLRCGVGQTIIG